MPSFVGESAPVMTTFSSSKIAVVGAGAVGCYFGGMLARHGADVTFIARPQHVDAMQARGLFMECLSFQEHVPVKASTDIATAAHADLILLCVKSPDTEIVGQQLQPLLAPQTVVLSLQNGVDNVPRLQQHLSQRIFPAVVYVATAMAGPGHLKHNGRGELVIGEMPASGQHQATLQSLAALLDAAGIPCEVSDRVKDALWFKFLINCVYNAVSAIGQIEYGRMVQVPEVRQLMDQLTQEFLQVAAAEGVHYAPEFVKAQLDGINRSMAGQRSSTAQDLARGKHTEIDHLNGWLVQLGQQHGIPTPTHQTVYALVKLQESRL